jgi:hypothetical protein
VVAFWFLISNLLRIKVRLAHPSETQLIKEITAMKKVRRRECCSGLKTVVSAGVALLSKVGVKYTRSFADGDAAL